MVHHQRCAPERAAKSLVQNNESPRLVSIASLWEIAIKSSLGKLKLSEPFESLFPSQIHSNGFSLLPITIAHVARVSTLPFHHRDPFDRLLAAQALVENIGIVSTDAQLDAYGVTREW